VGAVFYLFSAWTPATQPIRRPDNALAEGPTGVKYGNREVDTGKSLFYRIFSNEN
jgi:hypothetical protein